MSSTPALSDAIALLKSYDCGQSAEPPNAAERLSLQQALKLVRQESDRHIFGILASDLDQGLTALQAYTHALDYPAPSPLDPQVGPVYIKFTPETGKCYVDGYTGHYRGVLVSCQSDIEGGPNLMVGHLPLDLFSVSDR
jgi:hypothetical protein